MNKKILVILFAIIFIGGFLRFFKLNEYPIQLNHDEISQIYDTVSIVQTGKDIYGNFLPLAFPSTGDYKVGHYIYITILPYLIFGMKEITIRLPSAFFGTLEILAVFLFVRELTKNLKLALISASLVAVMPSEIFYSRKSFESIIAASLTFFGLFLLSKFMGDKIRKINLILTSLILVLPMYIYTSYTMVIPLIVFAYYFMFRKNIQPQIKRFKKMIILWGILILPLIFIISTNAGVRFRASSVFILQDASLGKQLNLFDISNPPLQSLYKFKFIAEYSFIKYLNQFDPILLFAKGLDLTNQGIVGLGPLLITLLPFFLLGVFYIIRSDPFLGKGRFILIAMIIAMIPSGLTFEDVSPHRSVLGFTFISIISAFGIFKFVQFMQNSKIKSIKMGVMGSLGLIFILNYLYAVHIYTVNYPYEKSQQIHYPYKDVALYAWSNYSKYDRIIVDPKYGQTVPVRAVAVHYYLAYYGNYSPSKFQNELKTTNSGMSFDKFSIREIDWRVDYNLKNTLIIASPWSLPESVIKEKEILKTFTFYDKNIAFYAIEL